MCCSQPFHRSSTHSSSSLDFLELLPPATLSSYSFWYISVTHKRLLPFFCQPLTASERSSPLLFLSFFFFHLYIYIYIYIVAAAKLRGRYCQCFATQTVCTVSCNCHHCYNNASQESMRLQAINLVLERNPTAFDEKFKETEVGIFFVLLTAV